MFINLYNAWRKTSQYSLSFEISSPKIRLHGIIANSQLDPLSPEGWEGGVMGNETFLRITGITLQAL